MLLNEDLMLKSRFVNKQSQVFKRNTYLQSVNKRKIYKTENFYKKFTESKLQPGNYDTVFLKNKNGDNGKMKLTKDKILDTEEEDKLEILEKEREKQLGINRPKYLKGMTRYGSELQ